MKTFLPLLRHRLLVLLLAAGACATFSSCVEDEHRPHHRGYYDHHRDDRRHDRYDDRHDGGRYRDSGYRDSSTTYSGGSGTSVTVRRDAPVTRSRTDYYDR